MDIGEGVIVHAFAEVDGVEDLHLILSNGLKRITAFHEDASFRISHHIGTVHLEKVRFQPESGLTGTGSTDDQDILVSCCSRILGAVAHGQTFRRCQDHVVLKLGIHEWLNIRMSTPSGGTVFLIVFEVLGVFVADINRKVQSAAEDSTNQEIHGMKARERIAEGCPQRAEK